MFVVLRLVLKKSFRQNKANLRDMIAATGLVILKFDSNRRFSVRVTMKFDGWLRKTIGYLLYTTSIFVHHFKAIGEFKLELKSGNTQFGSKLVISCPVWPYNLTDDLENNTTPLLYNVKLCTSFQSHRCIQTGVTFQKPSIRSSDNDSTSFWPPGSLHTLGADGHI